MSNLKDVFKGSGEGLGASNKEVNGIERRAFLKAGLGGAALLLGSTFRTKSVWAATITLPDGKKLVLTKGVVVADKDLCSGCRTCEAVCPNFNSSGRNTPQLARLSIEKDYVTCDYEPQACHQCSAPVCLEACPEEAIQIDEAHGTYARVLDEKKCIGCEACLEACEERYGTPRPTYDSVKGVCIKCHLCYGDPQCVRFCPLGALRVVRSETGVLTGYPFIKSTKEK